MFLIPFGTDAPVYYFPWGTIGLIVANVLVTLWSAMNPAAADDWILSYAQGLHPLQWISAMFIHGHGGSPLAIGSHLFGNMIFLWGFGLAVEGKIGWKWFVPLYLAMGVVHLALIQTMTLALDHGSLMAEGKAVGACGASGVVYSVMAMALVWAPRNELTILVAGFIMRLFVFTFEISYLTFGLIKVGLQFVLALTTGFYPGSEFAHLLGFVIGFPVGVLLLKKGWVDCENWDLFSLMAGRHLKTIAENEDPVRWRNALQGMNVTGSVASSVATSAAQRDTDAGLDDRPVPTAPPKSALKRIRMLLEQGKPTAAYAEYVRLKGLLPDWSLEQADLKAMIQGLLKGRQFAEAVPLLEEMIQRFPDGSDRARIRLAGIATESQQRPAFALRILAPVDRAKLTPDLAESCRRIESLAHQMMEDGVIELEGRGWS
ncbi:MAG: rhomboid family intramembrane serine protease [Planctomycetaceae bacterium]|nr:rhomboid family intramembrane serine protease [Planctomycetaceae bacterium]